MTIQSTLFIGSLFSLLASGIYGYIGWRLSKRVVPSPEARQAWQFFALWWYGLAASTLINGLLSLFGALGVTNLPLFLTATYVNIPVLCIALLGLLYYLIYLFTGDRRALLPLALFYLAYYILLVYYITASLPSHVDVGRWTATIAYSVPLRGPFFLIVVALLLIPQIAGGFAYFTLYFHLREATQKYRVLLVSWSIIIWFASPLLALTGGLADEDWWQLASRFIGLVAALVILMAYLPPVWLKQRYGITSLNDEKVELS
jgi:hypothetical protein